MKKKSIWSYLKEKSFMLVLGICIMSAITMVVIYQVGEENKDSIEKITKEEVKEKTEVSDIKQEEEEEEAQETSGVATSKIAQIKEPEEKPEEEQEAREYEDWYTVAEEESLEAVSGDTVSASQAFADTMTLAWPVEGSIIMPYSMDKSIYFATLKQYRYNPALIIGTEEEKEVSCAANGIVTEIGKNDEYGHYVVMDLGSGYAITYGQIMDIQVKEGDECEQGMIFAKVCHPTRCYIQEGENLYLKLTKDDETVNPLNYLE